MRKILATTLLLAAFAWADQVTLKNGDRITGSIVKSDTKELVIKTESAAEVKVQWSAITGITADGPLYLELSDGQTVAGAVNAANGQVQIRTQAAGTVSAAMTAVKGLRNQAEQTAHETEVQRLQNPRMIDLWTGFLDMGFAATKGNASTQTFTLSTRADRATNRDKISVYYTSIFSSNSTTGTNLTTANSKRGGVLYDVNFNKKWFGWGSVDIESDEFQKLDLRFVPQGGAGYHAVNTDVTKLDLRAGASGNREFFSTGLRRNSAEVVIGEDFSHSFNKVTSIQEKIRFFPNVSASGNYRFNFDTTFSTALAKWLSWQVTISDRYLSNPVPGRKTNDILYSTGVRLTFAK